MAMIRKASAVWNGEFKTGQGTISTDSGCLSNTPYGVSKRFGEDQGTNPEELIGAAHASCFSMALSLQLGDAGFPPSRIETTASITFEKVGDGWGITKSHLETMATVPNIDNNKFQELANKAKEGCPISKLLNAEIGLDAKLG